MTQYRGVRLANHIALIEVVDDEGCISYHLSRNAYNPEKIPEFEWGYNGHGPWHTAQFLLLDATGDPEIVKKFSIDFESAFVDHWSDGWTITSEEILQWLASR